MLLIIGIGRSHADKKILIAFAGQQIPIAQRVFAEFGQQRIARRIDGQRIGRIDRARILSRPRSFLRRSLGHFNSVAGNIISTARCLRIPKIHSLPPKIALAMFYSCSTRSRNSVLSIFSIPLQKIETVPDIHKLPKRASFA